jgi:hypothetical protein
VNRRRDDHREDLYRYYVGRFADLRDVIAPLFLEHPLRTSKRETLRSSHGSSSSWITGEHLTRPGLIEIAEIAKTMNREKPSKVLRILRDHTPTISPLRGEMKRWSDPCGDAGRSAETTGPPIEKCADSMGLQVTDKAKFLVG